MDGIGGVRARELEWASTTLQYSPRCKCLCQPRWISSPNRASVPQSLRSIMRCAIVPGRARSYPCWYLRTSEPFEKFLDFEIFTGLTFGHLNNSFSRNKSGATTRMRMMHFTCIVQFYAISNTGCSLLVVTPKSDFSNCVTVGWLKFATFVNLTRIARKNQAG
jgi:hypothetical protein